MLLTFSESVLLTIPDQCPAEITLMEVTRRARLVVLDGLSQLVNFETASAALEQQQAG